MASRFYDVMMAITILNLAIALVNGAGLFGTTYIGEPGSKIFEEQDLKDLSEQSTGNSMLDYFTTMISWAMTALGVIKDMLVSVFWVYLLVVDVLGGHPLIGGLLQGGVVLISVVFFIQFLSRYGWRQTED